MTKTTNRDGSRFYTVPNLDGDPINLPSVTTILRAVAKPALMYWAANAVADYAVKNHDLIGNLLETNDTDGAIRLLKGSPWSQRDKAANVGTSIHDIIESLILTDEADISPSQQPYVDAWVEFSKSLPEGRWDAAEMVVYNLDHRYAGTLDALYRDINGHIGAFDWKVRKGKLKDKVSAYETERLQVSAYMNATHILLPDGSSRPFPLVRGGSIVMLCDDGFAFERVHADDWPAFVHVCGLFGWMEGLK